MECSGVRIDVQDGTNDAMSGAQGAPSDVKTGEREQPPPLPLLQLPAQPSNSAASGSRRNADPHGKGYKFRQGVGLHFLHHPVAVGLDGALSTAQLAACLLMSPRMTR